MANAISGGFNNQTGRYEQRLSDGTVRVRAYVAFDANDDEIGTFESRDAAAGACLDAANEAGDDGEDYRVEECWI